MDYFTLQIANLFSPTTHNHICCVPLNEYNLGAEQNGTHYLDTPARPMDFRRLKNSCWHTVQYIMWLIQSTSYSSRALSESKSARVISYFQLSFKSNTSRRYVCYCFNVVDAPGLTVKRVPFEMAWSLHTHTPTVGLYTACMGQPQFVEFKRFRTEPKRKPKQHRIFFWQRAHHEQWAMDTLKRASEEYVASQCSGMKQNVTTVFVGLSHGVEKAI